MMYHLLRLLLGLHSRITFNVNIYITYLPVGKSCQPPPDLENGNVTYSTLEYMDKASYICDEGYKLIGVWNIASGQPYEAMCGFNGVWTRASGLRCGRKYYLLSLYAVSL